MYLFLALYSILISVPPVVGSPINRTQSDLSHVKSYVDELEMKKLTITPSTSHVHPQVSKTHQVKTPLSKEYRKSGYFFDETLISRAVKSRNFVSSNYYLILI